MDALVFLFFLGVLHIKALGDFFLVILTDLIEHEAWPPDLEILGCFSRFTEDGLCSYVSLHGEGGEQKKSGASSKPAHPVMSRKLSLKLLAQERQAVSISYSLHRGGQEKPW